jgi:hypothetical protein
MNACKFLSVKAGFPEKKPNFKCPFNEKKLRMYDINI